MRRFSCTIFNIKFEVVVGICAMEKKSLSKQMKEILTRIGEFEYIKIIIFSEHVILNVSVLLFQCQIIIQNLSSFVWRNRQ